jgi:hypothetical protein
MCWSKPKDVRPKGGFLCQEGQPKDTIVVLSGHGLLAVLYNDKDMLRHEKHDQCYIQAMPTDNYGSPGHMCQSLVSCQDGVGIHENEYGAFDYISLRVIMTR